MAEYSGDLLVREARARYFAANNLGDGGYYDRWVKFQIGSISLWMPNTKGRVAAVRFHDLHHIVTGYDTSWKGEAEIAAWEIASGCANHYAAWFLNSAAMSIGLAIDFNSVARAFWRGRCSGNLYRQHFDEGWLDVTVDTLRQRLDLNLSDCAPSAKDIALFTVWAVASLITLVLIVFLCLLAVSMALITCYWLYRATT
jgi:hypothetical protein